MKKILIISPIPSHPITHGNRARITQMALALRELGYQIFFLHVQQMTDGDFDQMQDFWEGRFWCVPYQLPPIAADWKRRLKTKSSLFLGRLLKSQDIQQRAQYALGIDDWYDGELDTNVANLCKEISFDAVIVEYVFFSRVLANFDVNVFKVIDTIDVFSNRHQLFLQENLVPTWFSTIPAQEARGLRRADAVIAINEDDASRLKSITNRPVVTVGHIVPLVKSAFSGSNNQSVLFIGSNNPMNVHSMQEFIRNVWPHVRAQNENARLVVAGDVCNSLDPCEGATYLGRVKELDHVYAQACLVINPVLIGTGLSIKTIEALGYSKPVVTTSAGARGLPVRACPAIRVADSSQEFATHILDFLAHSELMSNLSSIAFTFATEWNKVQSQRLLDLFERGFQKRGFQKFVD